MFFCKHFVICFFIVSAFVNFAYGILSERPKDTEAVVGSSVKFTCRTLDRYSVNWEHTPVGSKSANDIYISMVIVKPYDARMSMTVNRTTGEYELTIPSVQEADAGRYECIDGAGHGERQGAELVVLVSHLECQENISPAGVVGDNDCGLEPDSIEFRCILRYSGNVFPVLKWRKTGGDPVTPKTVTIDRTEHQVAVMTTINPHLDMDGSSYTCETSLTKYSWTSSRVKLLYVFNTSTTHGIDEPTRVNCLSNSSQPCQFSWFVQVNETKEILVTGQSAFIDKPGSYLCVAKCTLRGQTCEILPAVVEFSPVPAESVASSGYKLLPLIWSAAGLATTVIIGISIYLYCRHRERKKGRSNFSSKLLVTSLPPVQGIAAVGRYLYLIHPKHKAVSVYSSDYPYVLHKEIKRAEFSDPKDIAAFKNCLYITDAGDECVWKMGLSLFKTFTTFIKNIGSPFTISINANGDIMLARNPSSIHVYNLQGLSLVTVQIKEDIQDIQHAVRTRAGDFIVSHGIKDSDDRNITLVSSDGDTIKKYTGNCEKQLGPLNQPSHIAIGEAGSVYVADVGNDKLIVLDEDLQPSHVVPLHGSSQPIRLCYNDEQLLVGESNGTIQFFGVNYLAGLKWVSQVSLPKDDFGNDTAEESNPLLHAQDQPADN